MQSESTGDPDGHLTPKGPLRSEAPLCQTMDALWPDPEGGPLPSQTPPEEELLQRITVDPRIFGGKPVIRGRRLAVEHVLGMVAAGDRPETILQGYFWLEREDIEACRVYARRLVGHERVDPVLGGGTA